MNARAARGDILADYPFAASSFAMHPKKPEMYATIPSDNAIAIINTNTLAVEAKIFVGSRPNNLAFSPDGLNAYIANAGSNFVVVFDTVKRKVREKFSIAEQPQDVVFASQDRLFVLGTESIFQINATTGASAGPNAGDSYIVYEGELEISPDGNSLYYGNFGLSPASMYKWDVSKEKAKLKWESPHGPHGSNGQRLKLSHNGRFLCYATGSGQNNYDITKFDSRNMLALGTFETGAYPREITFSPDDKVAYAVHTDGEIDVFDTRTFLHSGTIRSSGEAKILTVDRTGRYLFAGYPEDYYWESFQGTRVFDTGRATMGHPKGDFNGDSRSDILWQNSSGAVKIWHMDGESVLSSKKLVGADPTKYIIAVGDFDGDTKPDLLLRNADQSLALWCMDGTKVIRKVSLGPEEQGWTAVAAGDLDGDWNEDILLRHSDGSVAVWFMKNSHIFSSALIGHLETDWSIVGSGHFNSDGRSDILIHHTDGSISAWLMDGSSLLKSVEIGRYDPTWKIGGTGDFDGDDRSDILFRNARGQNKIWFMKGTVVRDKANFRATSNSWEARNY